MIKNTKSVKNEFRMTRNDLKSSNVNKIGASINEILVKSLDLVENFQNFPKLPSIFLQAHFDLDENKIY